MGLGFRIKKAWKVLTTARTPSEDRQYQQQQQRISTLRKASAELSSGMKRYPMTDSDQRAEMDRTAKRLLMDPQRKAISSVNSYLNINGIPRPLFSKADNDYLALNWAFGICEKAIMDYVETIEWEVKDDKKQKVESATDFLEHPNPQDTFPSLIKKTIPDLLRYDAASWVKTRNLAGKLLELKGYSGPEFWMEIDDRMAEITGQYGMSYFGPWSHGYVKRYWQHSKPGLYIPFAPDEICYIMLYPRTDGIYGTDFIQRLHWPIEYLTDSTKAAGMTFANGVGPSLVWKHPELTALDQLEERNIEIEMENKGPENFGNILHLIGEEEIETVFPDLMNMQWIEGQQYISQLVWAMFGFSSSEFTGGGDVNRATAYINRNITKSRMLAPILRHLEKVINSEVLPELDGYEKTWKFAFVEALDLDDEIKKTQINQAKASITQSWVMSGVPLEAAMTLAEVGDDLRTAVLESVDQLAQQEGMAGLQNAFAQNQQNNNQGGPGGGQQDPLVTPGEPDPNQEDDQPTDVHQEGYEGGSQSDSDEPEDDGQPKGKVQKGPVMATMRQGAAKAWEYVKPGQKPPAGVHPERGPKGGLRYDPSATGGGGATGSPGPSKKKGQDETAPEEGGAIKTPGVLAKIADATRVDNMKPEGQGEAILGVDEDPVDMAAGKISTLARLIEPHLTEDITQVAAQSNGNPFGLEFKVKGEDSLKKKIAGYLKLHPTWTPVDLKAHLYDANRYTILFTPDNMVGGINTALDNLRAKGYVPCRVRNYWNSGDGTYKGINTVLKDKNGQLLELQFHTDQSVDVKEKKSHALYKARDETDDPDQYKAITQQLINMWAEVQVPAGIEAIQTYEAIASADSNRTAAGATA